MKIIFAAYRIWALEVLKDIQHHPKISEIHHVSSIEELETFVANLPDNHDYAMVMLCGWSWQVSQETLAKIPVISEHPAYLDEYSLGTPLQNQIVDGISITSHRVVKIGYPELGAREYSAKHEVDMSLSGNMDDILDRMWRTSYEIYSKFLDDWPHVIWSQWPKAEGYRAPRKPRDSRLTREELSCLSTQRLYDHIRMLGVPYPNAFIEDDDGILYFERVSFKSKK